MRVLTEAPRQEGKALLSVPRCLCEKMLPALLLALAGCSSEESKEAVARAAAPQETVQLGGKATRTEGIAVSWEGSLVHVGDSWEAAQRVFPEYRRGAYQLRSLPERFGRDYEAHGWETNAGQGYGVITHDDLVVAAVYHTEDVDDAHARRLLDAQRAVTGDLSMNSVHNGKLDWSYWTSGSQRLMVLRDKGTKGIDVTVLMGDAKILDALGATVPTPANPATAPFLSTPPTPGAQREKI